MPYFFGEREGDRVRLRGGDARHLARSLRVRPGESINVVEPAGRLLTVRLTAVGADLVEGVIETDVAHAPEPHAQVTVGLAMLPAAALEQALARCTELGAARFLLIQAERSVARADRPERWAAICREAAMLAGRLRVPEVAPPRPLAGAWRDAVEPYLLDRTAHWPLAGLREPRDLTVFVGPEGGWTAAEQSLAGERLLSLGPRNLRAENAAAAAVAVALATRGG